MTDEMSPEAAAEAQKANCIFCKIIKGDIPSRKVYEDDQLLAIMDINPAVKGHVLIVPKEHYPILPLVPFPIMQHLFAKTYDVAQAIKDALLCKGVTVFIANGAVAGQQSPHFIYHIIPRDSGDGLDMLTPSGAGEKTANDALGATLMQKVGGMMQAFLRETNRSHLSAIQPAPAPTLAPPAPNPAPPNDSFPTPDIYENELPAPTPPKDEPVKEEQLNKLIELINENEELKQAIIERPDEVKVAVANNDKWRDLFSGVDIQQLSRNLQALVLKRVKEKTNTPIVNKKPDLDKIAGMFE